MNQSEEGAAEYLKKEIPVAYLQPKNVITKIKHEFIISRDRYIYIRL